MEEREEGIGDKVFGYAREMGNFNEGHMGSRKRTENGERDRKTGGGAVRDEDISVQKRKMWVRYRSGLKCVGRKKKRS